MKILTAWIEQVVEFDSKLEYLAYIEKLKKGRPQKYKEVDYKQETSGKVTLRIRKQYNNNQFPED